MQGNLKHKGQYTLLTSTGSHYPSPIKVNCIDNHDEFNLPKTNSKSRLWT